MPSFSNSEAAGHSSGNVPELGDNTDFIVPENPLVLQNRYVIVRTLGEGGMGTVFLAQDKRLSNRFCVVKKLQLDAFNNVDKHKAMTFFEREAMILSNIKHPNVVSIQDYFQEDGNYFLVMEYVKGANLHQLLRKRGEPFNERQVIYWASTILDVLQHLHGHKPPVIYRDIKPSNIMLGTLDGIKLVDFGIARAYAEQSENTHVVSAGYSPPEQYWGAADQRSDIYALGATMYYLLTGKEPVALETCSIRHSKLPVSEHLDKIIQCATAQDVWLRYQTADEMRQALTEIPQKNSKVLFPRYVLITSFLAFISVAVFVFFVFIDKNGYFNQKVMTASQTVGNKARKKMVLGQLPFGIATFASNEEVITDPDGLKVNNLSTKQK